MRGTTRMLARRQDELAAGAQHLGWKVGFGSPAGMAALGIDRPLVGFLTSDRLLTSGATVSLAGWTRPLFEAEVVVRLGDDIGPDATAGDALAAVDGWATAIELADLDRAPDDIEAVLAGNVYHRHVLLGELGPQRPGPAFTVRRNGVEVTGTSEPEELTGELGWVLATTASTVAAAGGALLAGDVVITGSVVPPVPVAAGEAWHVSVPGRSGVEVHLTA
ncbi:MAG TPA: fumarylacetoacetate hydrolase family protein [Nocardioides sp.]|nr:fumarylacetoacetate hydrolase family protein [Nocardioides sp.]